MKKSQLETMALVLAFFGMLGVFIEGIHFLGYLLLPAVLLAWFSKRMK